MKNIIKTLSILFLLVSCQSMLTSCKRESAFQSEGEVFGYDYRKCATPCCSGFYIKIANDTFRFQTIPPSSDWDIYKEKFPFKVKLNWEKAPVNCTKELISVSKIEKA
jgi:hypothetical protein